MPEEDESFDPYRFGHPEVPPAPEFAPPGYKPPAIDLSKGTPYPGPPTQPPPYAYTPPPPPVAYPPYQPYQPHPQSHGGTSGKAVAALVLGIVSIVFCWTTFLDIVPVVLALIFGIIGLNETNTKRLGGRGQAIAGLVCAGIGAVLAIALTIVFVRAANHCGGFDNQDAPGFQQCVEDHLFS